MRRLALLSVLAVVFPAAAQEALPPPPPPPPFDSAPEPPPPWTQEAQPLPAPAPAPRYAPYPAPAPAPAPAPGTLRQPAPSGEPRPLGVPAPKKPGTIGEAPVAPAGSQAAPLHPDENVSHWRFALATGVGSKFGGMQLDLDKENPTVLLYFGGQADGLWTEGFGRAARIRFRMFTGGETEVYIPSDGDMEAAYMIGRREFRFVVGRVELGRYPALGVNVLAQVATLPCFEGSLSLAGDTMRFYYYLSPVEAAWVRYYGRAHIDHSSAWATESDRPAAASTGRLRYTVLLPPAVLLSLQGDLVKMWQKADLLVSGEGSLGYQALDQTATFNLSLRWNAYTRRGLEPQTET
ncbi:MAG TPA: hypothetical protein VLT61_08765, partial [Anaeromyxobacteraceae bacterium]|nr:hypothetical protein [Anaeromyxobacteraceae bacterium]